MSVLNFKKWFKNSQREEIEELMDSPLGPDITSENNDPSVLYFFNQSLLYPKDQSLNTFDGVFLPTWLSIWGIMVFLRVGFCIGHVGILWVLIMFTIGFGIAILTTLSLSAISTNGLVKGGGPYYMISRTIGVEFGGCTGIFISFANILGSILNLFGFLETLLADFNQQNGNLAHWLPTGSGWSYLYGSVLLLLCTVASSLGANFFARMSRLLFGVMIFSTGFVFVSLLFQHPFSNDKVIFDGLNSSTFQRNLFPDDKMSIATIFSILYPSCTGILAGASMSGDLKNSKKSIPIGSLLAVIISFISYCLLTLVIGGSLNRTSLQLNSTAISDVSFVPSMTQLGVYATCLFSIIGGILTTSKIIEVMMEDDILPLSAFFKKKIKGQPVKIFLLIWFISQMLIAFNDLNMIAPFITMFTLSTYGIINLACFLLKMTSAPNFRPNFKYFHWLTAFLGFLGCFILMFYLSDTVAFLSTVFLIMIWLLLHFFAPPKSWGDLQQALIYHQVRKYLLRLDERKEHVKYWRPQILLWMPNGQLSSLFLIEFSNALKKGSLFMMGISLLGDLFNMMNQQKETKKKWLTFCDGRKIKAFVEVMLSSSHRLAVRNMMMNFGLGGMKPNILLLESIKSSEMSKINQTEYFSILLDCSMLGKSFAIECGFENFQFDFPKPNKNLFFASSQMEKTTYIDIYPLFMQNDSHTFALVLQLACILQMVPKWSVFKLRVYLLVTFETEAEQEAREMKRILTDLRIQADLHCIAVYDYMEECNWQQITNDSSAGQYRLTWLSQMNQPSHYANRFHQMTAVQQNYILNQVMKKNSQKTDTVLVFMSFPKPQLLEKEPEESVAHKYVEQLDVISKGAGIDFPPLLLIQGQSDIVVTVDL